MLEAALWMARSGWPVFPCHPETKRPLVTALPGEPRGSGGLKRASTTPEVIKNWWKRWPDAMIGVPTGEAIGAFVVDVDAGVDDKTGEIFQVEELIAALETAIGAELPETMTVETPRGGRHLYFKHVGVGNRADLLGKKSRIDIRGDGGYVIVPPSVRSDGKAYAKLVDCQPDRAPTELVDCVLRRGRWGRGAASSEPADRGPRVKPEDDVPQAPPGAGDDRLRKYALTALEAETRKVERAVEGQRNDSLNRAAFALGQLVGAGLLGQATVRGVLMDAAAAIKLPAREASATIASGLADGIAQPRNLSEVRAKAQRRSRSSRPGEVPHEVPGSRSARPGMTTEQAAPPRRRSRPADQLEIRDLLRQARRRLDPPALEPRNGGRAGKWTPDWLGLPKEDPCPVVPLGYEGERLYMLNSSGQLVGWTEQRFTHAGIQRLFAATPNWPEWAFPRYGKAQKIAADDGGERTFIPIESFKDDEVRKGLFRAIDRMGAFSPDQKVRGRGAWKMADGSIYYHAGDELWIVEGGRIRAIDTGIVADDQGDVVFPRMAALAPPWPKPVEVKDNPARALIEVFRKFNWDRPRIDPVLMLGWIGVAYLGGALDWRPAVFLVGDKGTGKSTLQALLKELFGTTLMDSANATAASIYQRLSHDSRAVAIDEIEASADNRRVMTIMELARQASSGAFGQRGTADAGAGGVEFQLRSAFLFSAINTPPLLPQDLSRFCMLRLRELKPDAGEAPVILDADTCGRKLLARIMLEWHRFPRTLEAYRQVLAGGGHTGRGQDTYGTLLAAADLILGPELADELGLAMVDDLTPWSELLHVDTLPEVGDALANWRACINHLLQTRVPAWRSGERATVGQLLDDLKDGEIELRYCKRQLAQAGLGIAREKDRGWILAVPNQSPLLEQLFYLSRWQGAAGAGGWSEALRSGPRDVCMTDKTANRVRINGVQQRCTLVVVDRLADPAPDDENEPRG